MYHIDKININRIIDGYKEGRQFRPLLFGDLMIMNIYIEDLKDLAQNYAVTPEDYGLTYDKIYDYLYKHSRCEDEYSIMLNEIQHDMIRVFLFCSALSIPTSLLICFILYIFIEGDDNYIHLLAFTLFWGFFLFIIFFHLSYKYLYPRFYEWYFKKQEVKFMKKNGISYDKDIYAFINEVLFQAFVKNRDPLKAH